MTGLSTRSAVRVTNGALTMSHTSTLWYASTAGCESLDGPTRQRSHQYGECSPWAWWWPVGSSPAELEPALQRRSPVDAHVSAGRVVVLVRQGPVDDLGPATRHRHRHGPAGAEDAGQLAHGGGVVGNVLEHLGRDHAIEGSVGEGQRERVTLHRRRRMVRGDLPHLDHGGEGAPHLRHFFGPGVERHHRRAAAGGLERMAPEPAPEVEDQVPGPHAEPVVVDGQHQAAPRANGVPVTVGARPRGAPGRGSPAMTAS